MKKQTTFGVVILIAYVACYFLTSRMSLAHNRRFGIVGFFYAPPCSPATFANSKCLQNIHEFGKMFFFPIWWLDNALGGPSYISAAPQVYQPSAAKKQQAELTLADAIALIHITEDDNSWSGIVFGPEKVFKKSQVEQLVGHFPVVPVNSHPAHRVDQRNGLRFYCNSDSHGQVDYRGCQLHFSFGQESPDPFLRFLDITFTNAGQQSSLQQLKECLEKRIPRKLLQEVKTRQYEDGIEWSFDRSNSSIYLRTNQISIDVGSFEY